MTQTLRADILVRSNRRGPIAVVEIKNYRELPESSAVDIHKRVKELYELPEVPYFLLASQDVGYLWRAGGGEKPTARFPMGTVIERYVGREYQQRRLLHETLALAFSAWLSDLALGYAVQEVEPDKALEVLGFVDAIQDAEVVFEVPL